MFILDWSSSESFMQASLLHSPVKVEVVEDVDVDVEVGSVVVVVVVVVEVEVEVGPIVVVVVFVVVMQESLLKVFPVVSRAKQNLPLELKNTGELGRQTCFEENRVS